MTGHEARSISFSNAVQTVVIVVTLLGCWYNLKAKVEQNSADIQDVSAKVDTLGAHVYSKESIDVMRAQREIELADMRREIRMGRR